jgi:hypothetical protein
VESDSYFYEALTGLLAMLRCVYERAALDEPTAPTAEALRGTWDVLVDEIGMLAGPAPVELEFIEPASVARTMSAPMEVESLDLPFLPVLPVDHEEQAEQLAQDEADEERVPFEFSVLPAAEVIEPDVDGAGQVIFPARFFRMELVAC